MKKISEEEFLEKCLEFLDYFDVDYSKDIMEMNDGGTSCIMNSKSQFYELFCGRSINSVAQYVAKKLNKKIIWKSEEFDD
jgi:hypothetical protein